MQNEDRATVLKRLMDDLADEMSKPTAGDPGKRYRIRRTVHATIDAAVPVIDVAEMRESHVGVTYWTRITVGNRSLTPSKSASKGRAEYEAAMYRWLLLGEPKPDILAFDTDLPTWPKPPAPPESKMLAILKEALSSGDFNETSLTPAEINAAADWVIDLYNWRAERASPQAVPAALTERDLWLIENDLPRMIAGGTNPRGDNSGVVVCHLARHCLEVIQKLRAAPQAVDAPVARSLWVHDLDGPTETIYDKREPFGEDSEWTQFYALKAPAKEEAPKERE